MNTLDSLFPSSPEYTGYWQAIYLEPIVGSGERISVAVAAFGGDGEYKIIQSIRSELLDCLYGAQAANMQSMIDWVVQSAHKESTDNGGLQNWAAPIGGVSLGMLHQAADEDINGILRQAIRFSSSLSSIALDADREEDEEQPRRYSENWARNISHEMKTINPHMSSYFKKKLKISDANVLTSFGFLNDKYVSNFGILVPSRLSASLNSVKAKLFDLEALKKSNIIVKPEAFEIIIGTPSYNDPTLSDRAVKRLQETIEMVGELAEVEGIDLYQAESAQQAAHHIQQVAA